MPEVGGPEVAARLRARRPDVKIVYMSGYADSALYRRGLSESDAFMLRKPFTPEALVGKVEEALRGCSGRLGRPRPPDRRARRARHGSRSALDRPPRPSTRAARAGR